MSDLIIIGASGQGKVIADIAEKSGYKNILFLDDNLSLNACGGYKVEGGSDKVLKYRNSDFFVAIGNPSVRRKIHKSLVEKRLKVVSLIHPNAVIGKGVSIGEGSAVMAGAVINPDTKIGNGCIVNTCASVDHDCVISDYAHISVGAHVAGTVNIGENTWIGAGATVSNNIDICADCMIGAGAVVVKNITGPGTYIGIPARKK